MTKKQFKDPVPTKDPVQFFTGIIIPLAQVGELVSNKKKIVFGLPSLVGEHCLPGGTVGYLVNTD